MTNLATGAPAFELSLADIMHDVDPPAAHPTGAVAPRLVDPETVKRETGPRPSRLSRRWFARFWPWRDAGNVSAASGERFETPGSTSLGIVRPPIQRLL